MYPTIHRCFEYNLRIKYRPSFGKATCLWSLQRLWVFRGHTAHLAETKPLHNARVCRFGVISQSYMFPRLNKRATWCVFFIQMNVLHILCLVSSVYLTRSDLYGSMLCKTALALVSIAVGGRHFWRFVLAGGPPFLLYTYLIHHLYIICIYTTIYIFDGPPATSKTRP